LIRYRSAAPPTAPPRPRRWGRAVWCAVILLPLVILGGPRAVLTLKGTKGVLVQDGEVSADMLRLDAYATCDGATDDTSAVQTALNEAAGKRLWIPSGCRVNIAGPSAGAAALSVPSGTRILCEDHTAGFVLQGKQCNAGRYVGAACTADADCLGGGAGSCAGTAFAPTAASTYTLLKAAASGKSVELRGCRIWANQRDAYGRCSGGTNNGRACLHFCSGATSIACDDDGDCTGFGTCSQLSDCKTAASPGTCSLEPGRPSGDGNITAIDFSPASDAVVQDVLVNDQVRGGTSIAVGSGNGTLVEGVRNQVTDLTYPASFGGAPNIPAPTFTVDKGITSAGGAIERVDVTALNIGIEVTSGRVNIEASTVVASATTSTGVRLAGIGSTAVQNTVTAGLRGFDVAATRVLVEGNVVFNANGGSVTAFWIADDQTRVVGNQTFFTPVCVDGDPNAATANLTFMGNRCLFGAGTKVRVQGAGWQIVNNYLAWGSLRPVIEIGNIITAKRIGTNHPLIANNVVHTEVKSCRRTGGGGVQWAGCTVDGDCGTSPPAGACQRSPCIWFADTGQVCNGGSKINEACTADNTTDCPGATCGDCCVPTSHVNVTATNNTFLACGVVIDADDLSTNTSIGGLEVANNMTTGQVTLSFFDGPANAQQITDAVFGTNGLQGLTAVTSFVGFDWKQGIASLNGPLKPEDENVTSFAFVRNKEGAQIDRGMAVKANDSAANDATQDNSVKKATAAAPGVAAIMLEDCPSGNVCKAAFAGATTCLLDSSTSTVTRGSLLKVSGTAGKLAAAGNSEFAVAVALSCQNSTGSNSCTNTAKVRCMVGSVPPSATQAAPIYRTAFTGTDQTFTTTETVIATFAPVTLTGGKDGIITVTAEINDTTATVETSEFRLYDNGGSSCGTVGSTSPTGTILEPATGEAGYLHTGFGNGLGYTITMQFVDTLSGTGSGTVTGTNNYCLTGKNQNGNTDTMSFARFVLVEPQG
jgi:hypothetical protein